MPIAQSQLCLLQEVLAAAEEGVLAVDPAGVCTYANPVVMRMLGLTSDELIGRDTGQVLRDFVAGTPEEPPHGALGCVLAGEEGERLTGCVLRHSDGQHLPVDLRLAPLRIEGTRAGAVVTFYPVPARDGERQERLEEELRRGQAWLHAVVRHAPLAIWALDPAGNITFSEGRGLEPLGLKPGQMVGQNMFEAFADFPEIIADARRATSGEEFTTTREYQGIIFDTRYSPLHDRCGTFVGCIVASTDITERVRAADAMLLMADQRRRSAVLDERNRMAREIHDTLAQGFTGIIVHLEAAEAAQGVKPEESVRHMLRAREVARRSLAEARRSVWALRPTALDGLDLAAALARLSTDLLASSGVGAKFRSEGTPRPLEPEVEENLLRIAQEALNNILHHAAANEVEIVLAFEGAALVLRVRDDGRGFDAAARTAGKGFGLISMQERAERIGADLNVISSVGAGTEVVVVLPWPTSAAYG